jgi:hypothetical protein
VEWVGASRHLHQNLGLPSAEALGYFRDAPPGLDGCGFGVGFSPWFPSAAEAVLLSVFSARLKPCPDTSQRRDCRQVSWWSTRLQIPPFGRNDKSWSSEVGILIANSRFGNWVVKGVWRVNSL